MNLLLAVIVGTLYGTGVYLMMRRSVVKLIIGLALLSHGSNLLIFLMGGLTRGQPPIIRAGAKYVAAVPADPLPQALILTAIVIGFGVMAFAVVLIRRVHQTIGTADLDELQATDMLQ
jgi:multicomponent Na+:H+ antiporter subunit C